MIYLSPLSQQIWNSVPCYGAFGTIVAWFAINNDWKNVNVKIEKDNYVVYKTNNVYKPIYTRHLANSC